MDKSEEIITQATKKMQQINEAYEILKAKFK
jgi:DnaJ like chaperone protein